MFNSLKSKVLDTIGKNGNMEITNETNYKESGIYMIYIDNFNDEKIIPIYIGKTTNFQKRYKQHLSEIMTLNRFEYDNYISLLYNQFYEGNYKACKIFKYMLEHDCSLKDFHMIILEKVEENLEEKEQEYFNIYKPAFFGFNQLNTRIEIMKYYSTNKRTFTEHEYIVFCNVVEEDIKNLAKYKNYGYTMFNFRKAFIDNLPYADEKNIDGFKNIRMLIGDINIKLKTLREDILNFEDMISEQREKELEIKLDELRSRKDELKNEKDDLMENIIEPKISDIFKEYKIRSEIAYQNFIDSILSNNEEARNKFIKYIEKRKLEIDFYNMFNIEINEMNCINDELSKYKILIGDIVSEKKELCNKKIYHIVPSKEYKSFPLKDMYYEHDFKDKPRLKNNTCEINIAISSDIRNKQPEIIKMDYRIINEEKIIEKKDIFIKNYLTCFWETDRYYFEKDYENPWIFRREPFKLGLWDCNNQDWLTTYISIGAEFKTGINEHTIKGRTLVDLKEVMKEIEKHTNENTLFIPTISESTTCLQSSFYCENKKTLRLSVVKALMSYEKPHHK
ncbi:hypothetical protein [Clostridium saccharoperbutylacetonicum]